VHPIGACPVCSRLTDSWADRCRSIRGGDRTPFSRLPPTCSTRTRRSPVLVRVVGGNVIMASRHWPLTSIWYRVVGSRSEAWNLTKAARFATRDSGCPGQAVDRLQKLRRRRATRICDQTEGTPLPPCTASPAGFRRQSRRHPPQDESTPKGGGLRVPAGGRRSGGGIEARRRAPARRPA
jgi:hypothetical protein